VEATDALPFQQGERLEYVLKWSILPVGEATLRVLGGEAHTGVPSHLFDVTVRSYPVVDLFYRVRDHVMSYTDLAVARSLFYKKKQREGSHRRDVEVRFDWQTTKAHYFNKGEYRGAVAISAGTFDPLSIFYAFRLHPLRDGLTVKIPVTDGKRSVLGKATVIGRESIEVPAGRFDTFLIQPNLKEIGGIFKKSKNAKLLVWVTADERRILVKAKSAVAVGHFTAELVKAVTKDTSCHTTGVNAAGEHG
jgi:hypothetical protein